MKSIISTSFFLVIFSVSLFSQSFVPIPDASFRSSIETETGMSEILFEEQYGFNDNVLLSVQELICSQISSFEGIESCINVKKITLFGTIDNNTLPDISMFGSLPYLDTLIVSGYDLSQTNFSFVQSFANVSHLAFLECNISQIDNFAISGNVPLSLDFSENYLKNDDLFNLVNVTNLQKLNVYSYPNIANPRQLFSPECIDSLRRLIPSLTTVIYERAKDILISYISPLGSTCYIQTTDADTLGTDHYFFKYDTRFNSTIRVPGGAEVYKIDNEWHIKPRYGISIIDTAGNKRTFTYSNVEFRCYGTEMIPDNFLNSDISVFGFGASIGAISASGGFKYTILDLPYPLKTIVTKFVETAKTQKVLVPTNATGYLDYSKNVFDPSYNFSVSASYFAMPTFVLKNVSIFFNGATDEIGGGLTLSMGGEQYEFGADVIFSGGSIDKLLINMSTDIYLASTGLKITSIGGGVEDFTSDAWKIRAQGDVESVLKIPLYDIPVLKGEGLGISIAPFSQFEASGSLLLFDFPIAQGSCKYISRNNCISLKGSVNFSDILVGSLHASLQSTSKFSGIVNGVIKTPTTLPWKFKYLQNKTIASIIAMVDNTSISCEMDFYGMSIAHKITFNGSDQFPYFSYAIGDNLQSLTTILKSTQSMVYSVAEGTGELMIVVGNDEYLFDIELVSPSGTRLTKTNSLYLQYPETMQTVVIIKNPEPGEWEIRANEPQDFQCEVMGGYPVPVVEFHPITSNAETDKLLSFTVHNAPDSYRVFLYTDLNSEGFDGREFTTWGYTGNGNKTFNVDLNNHYITYENEIHIYLEIVDQQKRILPYKIYAPYTYTSNNASKIITEKPIISYEILSEDTIKLMWNMPMDEDANFIHISYQKLSDISPIEICTNLDSSYIYITDFDKNYMYELFASFALGYSPVGEHSDTLTFIVRDTGLVANTPPYFITRAQNQWVFYTDSVNQYTIQAFDYEGDELSYSLIDGFDTLGISISDSILSWSPRIDQVMEYTIPIVVSDGELFDTLYKQMVVYEKSVLDVSVSLSSYSFIVGNAIAVTVTDAYSQEDSIQITITNQDVDTLITLYRTGTHSFTGVIAVTQEVYEAMNVAQNSELSVNYEKEEMIVSNEVVAAYNTTPVSVESVPLVSAAIQNIYVYPNPAQNYVKVYGIPADAILSMYNQQGKKLGQYSWNSTISVSQLPAGVYYIAIQSNEVFHVLPFVKQ